MGKKYDFGMKRFVGLGVAIWLGGGVTVMAQTRSIRIVALGDSTTAGTPFFQSPLEAPPDGAGDVQAPYTYWVSKAHPEWKVLNRGINGQRTDEIHARFDRDVLQVRPAYVVILAGVNDIYQGRSLESVEADLLAMYQDALLQNITPVACTVLPFSSATPAESQQIAVLNLWIKQTAKQQRIPFCDFHHVVADPDHSERLRSSPDGLHPDRDGYHAMGRALALLLEELEKK
jgi:lysophospholipase L1-like esterase